MRHYLSILTISLVLCGHAFAAKTAKASESGRWTAEKANAWYAQRPWMVGCNFIPSTAENQLEMWQSNTFDLPTIDRELGWAQGIGFNTIRVFLHNLVWQEDHRGFLERMDQFLAVADRHHIQVAFVFFDSCWDPDPQPGPQPPPRPFVHNSRWVQSPGTNYLFHPKRLDELKPYVQDVIEHFRDDRRIAFWDLFNEPDNNNNYPDPRMRQARAAACRALLRKAFQWAREVNPTQPLTSGVWGAGPWDHPGELSPMQKIQLSESDIITFHCYKKIDAVRRCVGYLRRYGRPVICTEYMARPLGSTFNPVLGYFKGERVGALNWGFVSGKTQTIYPWDSWTKVYTNEPAVWFHDIFRTNGTPYKADEVEYIKSLTGAR